MDLRARNTIVRIAVAAFLFVSLSTARADLHFPYVDPATGAVQDIIFTSDEMRSLQPLLSSPFEPAASTVAESYRALPEGLKQKLRTLSTYDMSLHMNAEAKKLQGSTGITPDQLRKLRAFVFDHTAKGIIRNLRNDPKAQARLMGRDMNEVYQRTVSMLSPGNQELGLNDTEKQDLLSRVKLPVVSRDVARTIRTPDALKQAFEISPDDEARASHIMLVDGGYEGTIPNLTQGLFNAAGLGPKVKWYYLWKSPRANASIAEWDNGQMPAKLKLSHPVLNNDYLMAMGNTSFRISGIEHQVRWNGTSRSQANQPVYIMLDLDDTVLKEIPVGKYKGNPSSQAVTYTPGAGAYAKYQARINAPPDPGKVIHYELLPNGQMTGYVTTRPGMDQLFKDLEPMLKSGAVKILVTSANDPQRTEAMVQQLKIAGKTLADWGATAVPSEKFSAGGGIKDIAMLRRNLQLPPGGQVIALDDLPNKIVNGGANDRVEGIRPWNHGVVYDYLDHTPAFNGFALADAAYFRHLFDLINRLTQEAPSSPEQDRLRVLGQLLRLSGTVPDCTDNLEDLARAQG